MNDKKEATSFDNSKIDPPDFHLNAGASSILLIFVTLCMVAFAVLSIVSANADRKLTNRVSDRAITYYEACNRAQDVLALIDNDLLDAYLSAADETSYFAQVEKQQTFVVDMEPDEQLSITITVLYPETPDGHFYEITDWTVKHLPSGTDDEASDGVSNAGSITIL